LGSVSGEMESFKGFTDSDGRSSNGGDAGFEGLEGGAYGLGEREQQRKERDRRAWLSAFVRPRMNRGDRRERRRNEAHLEPFVQLSQPLAVVVLSFLHFGFQQVRVLLDVLPYIQERVNRVGEGPKEGERVERCKEGREGREMNELELGFPSSLLSLESKGSLMD